MRLFLDTLATVRKLQAAGLSADQAEAVTTIVHQMQDASLAHFATKTDLGEIKAALREVETKRNATIERVRISGPSEFQAFATRLETKINSAESEFIHWLLFSQAALAGLTCAVLKFLH